MSDLRYKYRKLRPTELLEAHRSILNLHLHHISREDAELLHRASGIGSISQGYSIDVSYELGVHLVKLVTLEHIGFSEEFMVIYQAAFDMGNVIEIHFRSKGTIIPYIPLFSW